MSGRGLFVLAAGSILVLLLALLVVGPAIERGGAGELALVAGIALAVLLLERWLRTR
ncbi:MAG TPA: hypothetical protein VMJ92_00180 [Candidatus Limnocylindrales bacterium]|nr:hypothetical protein [Candidatus Limnocylindrales bacterium]